MPAGATYTPIQTALITASNTITNVTFGSIPSTYTDLVIVANLYQTGNATGTLRFNYDGSAVYSDTSVYSSTTTAGSNRHTAQTSAYYTSGTQTIPYQNNLFMPITFHINNYANTTTFKEFITKYGSPNLEAGYTVGLWRSTAAINAVSIYLGSFFSIGSVVTLYGITAA
jgi:hypothetical protein